MISLTPRQQKLLAFIRSTMEEKGIAPSYEEMATYMGLASKSVAWRMMKELEARGRVRVLRNRKRAIEIIEGRCPHCGKAI